MKALISKLVLILPFVLFLLIPMKNSDVLYAQTASNVTSQGGFTIPKITIGVEKSNSSKDMATTVQLVLIITILTLAPSIIIMMTGFTRIVIVLSFMRRALGLQTIPPNQVVVGLALFLTFFVMSPVIDSINKEAFTPLMENKITFTQFLEKSQKPLKYFMLKQTREKDLALFIKMAKEKRPKTVDDIRMRIVIPSFVISELKRAFEIGFLLYIPFLLIDMVISSILMSMGMMMLPPVMISMPFKIILFVLVDGWHLLIKELLLSFR